MALIKSISGIRGTIGGGVGSNLTPVDIVAFAAAFGTIIKNKNNASSGQIIIGRDARISGPMVHQLVIQTLVGLGLDVIDAGLATTPTVAMAVTQTSALGGIVITASHNPKQWNALKLLNEKGEFIDDATGREVLKIAEKNSFDFADVNGLGSVTAVDFLQAHIDAILRLPLVQKEAIAAADFSIVVDAVNSVGGFAVPALLQQLGVKIIHELNCEPTGDFAHNPEPLPEHLTHLCEEVINHKARLGIVVDPDVDRLALVCEDGTLFGEEYTLVAIADYYLMNNITAAQASTVSNLSSSFALRDITQKYGATHYAAAVGEVNVVAKMKEVAACIGGEGNGGIIVPELHYGRDALVGIALFLSHLALSQGAISDLRRSYPTYFMCKSKIVLQPNTDVDTLLGRLLEQYKLENCNTLDGLKVAWANEWVHIRRSNTEPILRIYTEAPTQAEADMLALRTIESIEKLAVAVS